MAGEWEAFESVENLDFGQYPKIFPMLPYGTYRLISCLSFEDEVYVYHFRAVGWRDLALGWEQARLIRFWPRANHFFKHFEKFGLSDNLDSWVSD